MIDASLTKKGENESFIRGRAIYLGGIAVIFPYVLEIAHHLSSFPSKAKLAWLLLAIFATLKSSPKYSLLLMLIAFPHFFVSMVGAKFIDKTFLNFWATINIYLFISYIGCYRGFIISRVTLIFSLFLLPFVIYFEKPNLGAVWEVWLLVAVSVFSGIIAFLDLVKALWSNRDRLIKTTVEIFRSSLSSINVLLFIVLVFLLGLDQLGNLEQKESGKALAYSILKDLTEFLSAETRSSLESFLSLNNYGYISIFLVVSIFLFQIASHHSKLWYKKSYTSLLVSGKPQSANPFLKGQAAIFVWTFSLFVYYFLFLYLLPIPLPIFNWLTGPVTWKTSILEILGGILSGFLVGFIFKVFRLKGMKFKLLRVWLSNSTYMKVVRFIMVFGPGVIAAPFFAWKSVVSTLALIGLCYLLIFI